MPAIPAFLLALQATLVRPESGEVHLRHVRQLTFGGQNAEAYFAASGRLLIFQRHGPAESCDQMYVMGVDGAGLHRVSSGRGRTTCGYFFDRDRRIFYSSTEHAGAACPPRPDYSQGYVWALYDYDLYTAAADGSGAQRLTTNPEYDAEGTLSPDGRTIVFTSLRDGDLDVYTMGVDGREVRRLTTTLGYDGGPFFSPDGKLIVYRAYHPSTPADSAEYRALLARRLVRPTRMDLWVMKADGSGQRQVTQLPGASFAPSFFPDSRRIIFASNYPSPTSEHFDLYAVNVDGTGLERITTDNTFNAFPMFSPDARPEHREAGDRRGRGHVAHGARHRVSQRHAAGRAVRAAPGGRHGGRPGLPPAADPGVAAAVLPRPGSSALPSHDPRLGPDGRATGALLRDGRQPRRVVRQPLLGLPAAVPHRGQAGDHLSHRRERSLAYSLEPHPAAACLGAAASESERPAHGQLRRSLDGPGGTG